MRGLAAGLTGLAQVVKLIATLTLVVSVGFNFVNIVLRYFFSAPIEWGEEVMLFMMVGIVFFGAVGISAQGRHIRMDLAVDLLPRVLRHWAQAFAVLCEGACAAVVVYVGVPVIQDLIDFDQRAEASNMPMAIPQSIVPVGLSLIALTCLVRLVLLLGGGPAKAPGAADDETALLAGE